MLWITKPTFLIRMILISTSLNVNYKKTSGNIWWMPMSSLDSRTLKTDTNIISIPLTDSVDKPQGSTKPVNNACIVGYSMFTWESINISLCYLCRNYKMKPIEFINQICMMPSTRIFLPNALILIVETHFQGINNLLFDRTLNVDARPKGNGPSGIGPDYHRKCSSRSLKYLCEGRVCY